MTCEAGDRGVDCHCSHLLSSLKFSVCLISLTAALSALPNESTVLPVLTVHLYFLFKTTIMGKERGETVAKKDNDG